MAELLLDSVNYITHDDVAGALQSATEDLIGSLTGPSALYPVTGTNAFNAFDSYDQLPFGIDGDLGSEGDLGHLCRDISRHSTSATIIPFPAHQVLIKEKVRNLILLTDTTSSGQQGIDFLDWLWASKSIKSWHSGRLIRFYYVTYLFNSAGLARVQSHNCKPVTKALHACGNGSKSWSAAERHEIEALCIKYGSYALDLGYQNMMSLQVFSYSCPDNVPSILRRGCESKGFRGLFETRPTAVCSYGISGTEHRLAAVAEWLGISDASAVAVVCHTLRRAPADAIGLSAELGLPIVSINRGLEESTRFGYVRRLRNAFQLTPEGVRYARGLPSVPVPPRSPAARLYGRFDYLPEPRSVKEPS